MSDLPTADPYVPGHGDPTYDVDHYDLDLDYDLSSNMLRARARLAVTAVVPTARLVIDLAGLTVDKLRVDGVGVSRWQHRGSRLVVRTDRVLAAGDQIQVRINYSGNPRPVRSASLDDAGWEELEDGVIVAAQPHGSPSWFPCNDRADAKATYRIACTIPSGYRAVSNGELVSHSRRGSAETWTHEHDRPMAPYLATLQIGRYDELTSVDTEGVRITTFGPDDLDDEAVAAALGRQPEMVATFARLFGPYPFASYAVVVTHDELEIPLESQTLSTFGRNLVRDEWDAIRLVAHELAHSWFGNAVTARRWRDIWLHEGFACYAEWLWSEESGGVSVSEHAAHFHRRLASAPQDLMLADPGPELMFDDRVYKRGALALHALRCAVGDEAFFTVLRTWVATYAGGSVNTDDFTTLASEVTTLDCRRILEPWLEQTALPALPQAS